MDNITIFYENGKKHMLNKTIAIIEMITNIWIKVYSKNSNRHLTTQSTTNIQNQHNTTINIMALLRIKFM